MKRHRTSTTASGNPNQGKTPAADAPAAPAPGDATGNPNRKRTRNAGAADTQTLAARRTRGTPDQHNPAPQAPHPPSRGAHRKRKQGMGAAAATRHACAFLLSTFMSEGLQVSHVYLNDAEQLINENCEYTHETRTSGGGSPRCAWEDSPRDLRARLGERGEGSAEKMEQAAAAKRRKIDVPKSAIGDRMKKAAGDMRKLWGAPDDNG